MLEETRKIQWKKEIPVAEQEGKKKKNGDKWQLTHHISSPTGWINDPNGLCQKDGMYHVFFQYSPLNPKGGEKFWGHYQSRDFVHWDYTGIALYPDSVWDRDGVYSGCAMVEGDTLYLYYTGNVKYAGKHDHILSGREANTILVTTRDGINIGEKQLLMTNKDYGAEQSCHVRDPKVWKESGLYYMVQGARTRKGQGQVLVFISEDKKSWRRCNILKKDSLGAYMWECPDMFVLENERILSFSPQGLKTEALHWQNKYQSGYCLIEGDFLKKGACTLGEFKEWDMGFDFYAPQTFLDESGRRILIGWMGMADCEEEYDNAPTVRRGWQHCLTLPRELVWSKERRRILQRPIKEMEALREKEEHYEKEVVLQKKTSQGMEIILMSGEEGLFGVLMNLEGLQVSYCKEEQVVTLEFMGESSKLMGSRRKIRRASVESLWKMQAFLDSSAIEIFFNDGELVFSTRYYPDKEELELQLFAGSGQIQGYYLKNIEVTDKSIW